MIFSGKAELLELYNAINGSHYTDPDAIEIVTLENAVYMSVHNDISFILDMRVYLYEHQSTVCPNMPLRFLEYIADQYAGLIEHDRIYGSRPLTIPAPRFVIFYNGSQTQPDRQILRLSDMYRTKEEHPALELEAVMLNVNRGHNPALMHACKTLADYAEYTDRVRRYREDMSLEEVVERTIDECIHEGILEEFLRKNRSEAVRMSIYDYEGFTVDKYVKMEREYAYEDGHESGYSEGRESGYSEGREYGYNEGRESGIASSEKRIVLRLHAQGRSMHEICELTGIDVVRISAWTQEADA